MLLGKGGNDYLVGGDDGDRLDGGPGWDSVSYAGSNVGVKLDFVAGSIKDGHAEGDSLVSIERIVGSSHGDSINGGSGGDVFVGDGGADTLRGGGGHDWLEGGPGSDSLYGGADNDALMGGADPDLLDGGPGDRDSVGYKHSPAGVTVTLPESGTSTGVGGDAQGDTIRGVEHVGGSGHDDALTGNSQDNHLHGLAGVDVLRGEGGNDWLEGGAGADSLYGGSGWDTAAYYFSKEGVTVSLVAGTTPTGGDAANDVLSGFEAIHGSESGDDRLAGDSGNNHLVGYGGADTLRGGGGADRLIGGSGADRLYGGADNDTLEGGAGADWLDGGLGDDTVSYAGSDASVAVNLSRDTAGNAAGAGHAAGDTISGFENVVGSKHNDDLRGDEGSNALSGGDGKDWISGDRGNDELRGGGGNDRLIGGGGADTLWGEAGADLFAFVAATDSTSGTRDLIKDFESSEGDRIDLSDLTGFGDEESTFRFIAGLTFSNRAGEVRYAQRTESGTAYTDVFGDADGNGAADFVVMLVGTHDLTASDFYLGS